MMPTVQSGAPPFNSIQIIEGPMFTYMQNAQTLIRMQSCAGWPECMHSKSSHRPFLLGKAI